MPARWIGYSKATKEAIALNEEFVQDNFEAGLLDNLKGNAKKVMGILLRFHLETTGNMNLKRLMMPILNYTMNRYKVKKHV